MIIRCEPELFEMFPAASVHGVVCEGVGSFDPAIATQWKEKAITSVASSGFTSETVLESPAVSEWRNAFQKFGVKPSKFRSSIEQLYRRALKQEIIETSLPLVNLYCYVSLIEMVPMGAYDLEKVEGDIVIRFSKADETFTGIGDSTLLIAHAGVVVYADDGGIICWAWNHRDASRVALAPGTNRAVFFADSSSQESEARAESAITLLADALSGIGVTESKRFVLNNTNPTVLF
ncbi:MAG TPA: phenylalanine--tRNA ligase beta subunit-related protein [Pyrinomonadaceae bacterium]|nr:phenylalanine--tRNA ligase beta subunit-related protein [Pyrinomonadaceae bacterium]